MHDEKVLLDDIFLQPWFLPWKTASSIRTLLPADHRHKMRFYFEDYGCLKCGKKKGALRLECDVQDMRAASKAPLPLGYQTALGWFAGRASAHLQENV